jgi:hypothetical protein
VKIILNIPTPISGPARPGAVKTKENINESNSRTIITEARQVLALVLALALPDVGAGISCQCHRSGEPTPAEPLLPGAAITARNVATNATYKTTSGEDGAVCAAQSRSGQLLPSRSK